MTRARLAWFGIVDFATRIVLRLCTEYGESWIAATQRTPHERLCRHDAHNSPIMRSMSCAVATCEHLTQQR
jgi:hypothetical protein